MLLYFLREPHTTLLLCYLYLFIRQLSAPLNVLYQHLINIFMAQKFHCALCFYQSQDREFIKLTNLLACSPHNSHKVYKASSVLLPSVYEQTGNFIDSVLPGNLFGKWKDLLLLVGKQKEKKKLAANAITSLLMS